MSENRSDKISAVTEWVREELEKNADPSYREFHRSLVPGLENFLGVRVPKLREISRKAAREDYWSFAGEADRETYEELMIRGMMIGYARLTREEQRRELEKIRAFDQQLGGVRLLLFYLQVYEKRPGGVVCLFENLCSQ